MNSKKNEERSLNLDDVVVLRKYSKGLIITDLYKETFCLAKKDVDTDRIFDMIVSSLNMHYFKNGNRYINLDLIKDVKTQIIPASSIYATKVLFDGGKEEVFNCATEIEANSLKRKILQCKRDTQNALEI